MIDTVVLSIPWGQFTILKPENFQPNIRNLVEKYHNGCKWGKYVQNPTRNDLKTGNYFPRLTIKDRFTRGVRYTPLRIEFSIPKLLYGNNLKEINPEDLNNTISELGLKLFQMAIKTSSQTIKNAEVINVHFCRNIYLSGGYTAQYVIRQLNKLNPSKKFDHNHRHFTNHGQALYFYSTTNQTVFYDKLADLQQSKRRSIDYHKNDYQQLDIFEYDKKEILRWETRLTHKSKLSSVFSQLGYQIKPIPFSLIFNQKLANQVLQSYWFKLYSPEANMLFQSDNPADILDTLIIKGLNPQKALQATTLTTVAQQKGVRYLRNVLETKTCTRNWYRINKQLQDTLKLLDTHKSFPFITDVEKAIGLYN